MMEQPLGTVMLIDDNQADLVLFRLGIERSGLAREIISFRYAEDALAHLRKDDRDIVDVIFLDINMPRMTGFEFLEAAAEEFGPQFCNVVVVMITTSLDVTDLERARRYEVVRHYFSKPLNDEHLAEISRTIGELGK